jgi:hypothetical protein
VGSERADLSPFSDGFVAEEGSNMSTRTLNHGLWWWILGAMSAAALWVISASVAAAGNKVLVRPATQTTFDQTAIGPEDAPVRMALFTSADRDQLKVQPARWGWGWGYRAPYYAYYPAPYYYSAPYYSYYAYSAPSYAYYAPPTYYSAAPYYSYYAPYYSYYAPAPVVAYRFPRRAFYGAYYW